jgi:hypothetical protein
VNVVASSSHRGTSGCGPEFALRFIEGRISGFEKDIGICLTPTDSKDRAGKTHAYFPALAACCGLLEYVTALERGNVEGIGCNEVSRWALKYMLQPDYDDDTVRILFNAFRHSVAHRGIASGVWVERVQGRAPRRVTWAVHANSKRPSCRLLAEAGVLKRHPPWPCRYTHRMHIHLKRLQSDLVAGVRLYAQTLQGDTKLQSSFEKCMNQLYPR